jgi:hypothetical protein
MTNYVDQFYAAVTELAGDGYIKQRLIRAYTDSLIDIDEDDLPIAVKERFTDIRKKMHSATPINGENPISASVRKMSSSEAGACAVSLLAIYNDLVQQKRTVRRRPAAKKKSPAVPYIVKSISG